MDLSVVFVIASTTVVTGLIFFFVIRSAKNKPLTLISEIVPDKKNPGLFHIFGAASYMPDDAPSFEKYRHYLLNTSDMKVIRGLEQIGSDFDIRSPFATRCLEQMKTISGRDLAFTLKNEDDEDDDDDSEDRNKIEIIEHDKNESDTSVPKKIKGNAIEVFDTSFGERNTFSMKITLDGLTFSIPKVNGMSGVNKVLWRKNEQKLFIFYNRMKLVKFGVGLLVLDTSTGNVLFDDYFREN